ncbi:apoptosis facilitator Bcl-2-like protein 14 isoform X1 [Clupea harengus]|uniref:Apoptosis facilitator Bcl-2-like protein 14 isoform X1 n=1 Tax=Clupea harengus TaxID=7950 RepID=A0A6P8GW43_CLUHA|nr:apoptosis facilitator Bcl-2-like protein 14 isoform X1 [Clupea harengus]
MESPATDTALQKTQEPMDNEHAGQVNGVVPTVPKDSIERLILRAYAKRLKHPQRQASVATPTPSPTETNDNSQRNTVPKKKRKTDLRKNLTKLLPSCIRPQAKQREVLPVDDDGQQPACLDPFEAGKQEEETEAVEVADKLAQISGTVSFLPGEYESDNGDEDLVHELVKLLRESGDELNEKIKNNKAFQEQLQRAFTYSFFKTVMSGFLAKLNLTQSNPFTESPEKTKIAMTCDVVTRLSTMDTHPMSQAMGFGEKYLKDYFTPWVVQNGGWNQVFSLDEEEEEEEEVQ